MEGERATSPLPRGQQLVSTNLTGHGQGPLQVIPQKGHRENEVPEIQEQVILSPQKGLGGTKNHPGSFQSE